MKNIKDYIFTKNEKKYFLFLSIEIVLQVSILLFV